MYKLNIILVVTLIAMSVSSCMQNNQNKSMLKQNIIHEPIIPVNLKEGKNILLLSDFITDSIKIDSIEFSSITDFQFDTKENSVEFTATNEIPALSEMKIWIENEPYSVLLRKSRMITQEISFDANGQNYSKVQIAGSLNDWNPSNTNMEWSDGKWRVSLKLNPGKYHYQIVADDNWMLDPANPVKEDNNLGGFNSVLQVGDVNNKQVPVLESLKNYDNRIVIKAEQCNKNNLFVLWQNYHLPFDAYSQNGDEITIIIPDEAKSFNRSWIRVWSFNEHGISNDLLIPLEHGKVITQMSEINRFDKEASILYFMMVDRFYNGNKENDKKVDDPKLSPKANYFGGDIEGIKQKLDSGFFTDLGINTIWLSPITQNTWGAFVEYPEPHRKFSAYHGYWPISLNTVDKRFGTDNSLQALVDDAHSKGINIILDFVSNHVHQESQLYKDHPDWSTDIDLPDGTKNIRLWDTHRLTTWFDTFLPTWDFDKEEPRNYVSDSALYWIKKFDIDGFRHDATKHIPQKYWRTLTQKLKKEVILPDDKRLLQIGESFGSRELIGSYVSSGMLDGQFDFNLYFDARSVFALDNESFVKLSNSIQESLSYYGYHHLMGNITGNHDMARFISYAGEALSFDEEAQAAGWNRDIEVKNPVGYKKLSSLIAFTMTIPGIPVIYYGDEYGMPGAGDPDNRRQMKFDDLSTDENNTREITRTLTNLRRNNIALNFGSFNNILVNKDIYVYYREYLGQFAIIIFNKNSKQEDITFRLPDRINSKNLHAVFNNNYNLTNNEVVISLPANSFEILVTE